MAKHTKRSAEFKLQLVKEKLKGNSYGGLSKEWGVPVTQLMKWCDQYSSLGAAGLLTRSSHQHYTLEFKIAVVKGYHKKGLSLRDCCSFYNIPSQSTVTSWLRKYERLGVSGLQGQQGRPKGMKEDKPSKKKAKPLTRLEELEKENLYLKAENELLKKLEALTQKRETPLKKKR